ncbi:ceramide glucosyltransferase [Xylariales sp. PMI_506]|nr:ceramide glucosyltransferase [Xylariales sp. PMI_506]
MIPVSQAVGYAWLGWGVVVLLVQSIGSYKLYKYYSSIPKPPVSPKLPSDEVPHVTVIRPAKGLEPYLYECLASTFQQRYSKDKLTVYFCVPSKDDAAYAVMRKVLDDFPGFDARIFIEEEDPLLHGAEGHTNNLGPNPKVRNISRAYREAKGDTVWVLDCNVWIGKHVAGHMVDKLHGIASAETRTTPYKFVHQLPLVVDTASSLRRSDTAETEALLAGSSDVAVPHDISMSIKSQGGGRLEEMFISTTHAKFYAAINTVGIAPCVVGKSNMFRKSHLDMITDPAKNPILSRQDLPTGIDYFSEFICEDHLIGDLLWRSSIPGHLNHGLVWGELAVQPMAGMSVSAYIARRVRWLRVRKWTVLAATLVEPGVESLLCCFYASYGLTTIPWCHEHLGIPQTWATLLKLWVAGVSLWMIADRFVSNRLHAGYSIDIDENTPAFARGSKHGGAERRPFGEWFMAWLGREFLAMPIWTWAVLLGATVTWRGKKFHVRSDMSVVSIDAKKPAAEAANGQATNKID